MDLRQLHVQICGLSAAGKKAADLVSVQFLLLRKHDYTSQIALYFDGFAAKSHRMH